MRKDAVIITGATKRLGLQFSKQCLHMGYDVVAHYRSSKGHLHSWMSRNGIGEHRVVHLQADLTDDPENVIRQAVLSKKKIVGLINNASIYSPDTKDDPNDFAKNLTTNAVSPMRLSMEFSNHVAKGWIINITDAHIYALDSAFQNYQISKRLLEEITIRLAARLAPRIRVNALAPGAMLPPAGGSKEDFEKLKETIPLKKVGDLDALRSGLVFLIENTYVTGQILYIDGGRHLV